MRKCLSRAVLAVIGIGFFLPQVSRADSLQIGYISFDDVGTGDAFDLYNFTDGFVGAPDSIVDNELFSGTLTVNIQGVGNKVYAFSNIDSILTGVVRQRS